MKSTYKIKIPWSNLSKVRVLEDLQKFIFAGKQPYDEKAFSEQ